MLAPKVKKQFEAIAQNPGGSYLLLGTLGSGKYLAVTELASQLGVAAESFITIEPEGASIGIAQVHGLNHQLRYKNSYGKLRLIAVRDADAMTTEAQNAFLKLLEEPPLDTTIFLVSANRSLLLPTIISRCRLINFPPFSETEIVDYLKQNFELDNKTLDQISRLAAGSLGLAVDLARDPELLSIASERYGLIDDLLSDNLDLYQKLIKVGKVEGVPEAVAVLEAYIASVRHQLRQTIVGADQTRLKKLTQKLSSATQLLQALQANTSPRLVLTQLAMEAAND